MEDSGFCHFHLDCTFLLWKSNQVSEFGFKHHAKNLPKGFITYQRATFLLNSL